MDTALPVAGIQATVGDRYRVERELGAGGMATVYLAHDPRHDRRVAIKVLRPELAAIVGAERFLKEIRTTANLQHPHVLPLHDSGSADGMVWYVMPYMEGESLRDRLKREKQLPVADAIRIAREVASGLDYAHRKGVVHRDIKPENILLHEGDGQAVVADFGIALAVSRSDSASRMTDTGMSLGTPQYMSPEQAMGEREITARSDVYALGCVLYEMLAGEPPFTGPSAQAIFARVLTDEPRPLTGQRRTVPLHVERAVQTALAKVPADRFASAAEFSAALMNASPSVEMRIWAPQRSRRWLVPTLAALALLLVGAVAGRYAASSPADNVPVPPGRFSILLPQDYAVSSGGEVSTIGLSPDGSRIIYQGSAPRGTQLYMRRLHDMAVTPLPGTEGGHFPLFSPDGSEVAFLRAGRPYRVAIYGGTPTPMTLSTGVAGLWARADEFLVTREDGALAWVRTDSSSTVIARPDTARNENALLAMQLLPNEKILIMGAVTGFIGPMWVLDPETGTRELVTATPAGMAWYHDGMMAWVDGEGTIRAKEWDLDRDAVNNREFTVATDVRFPPGTPPQVWHSPAGALVYVRAQASDIVLVDRSGRETVVSGGARTYHGPVVSPDGSTIAVDVSDDKRDIWLLTVGDTSMSRLTFDNDAHDAMWMPDGRSLMYARRRGTTTGMNRKRIDGVGESDSVLHAGAQLTSHAVTADGSMAFAVRLSADGSQLDILRVALTGERRAEPFLANPYSETHPALSPDGQWLAYVSDETGRNEVYVRSLRDAARILVSTSGGTEPVWSRDGRELFYRNTSGNVLAAARLETAPRLRVRDRTMLFSTLNYEPAVPHANYDVTRDGRFVFVRNAPLREMVYLQNWTALARGTAQRGSR